MRYDKLQREARSSVGKGWWLLIDKYLPHMVQLAPDAEFFIKEKYGTLRIGVYGKTLDRKRLDQLKIAAEKESKTVCEECGRPGELHMEFYWIQTLCDQCAAERRKKEKATL